MTDQDVWIPFSDEASGFSFRYPSNWHRKPDGWSDFRIENGLNWMTVEYSDAAADTDARKMKDALKRSVCDEEGRLLDGCTCETVVLNAANEITVEAFLAKKIAFTTIFSTVAGALESIPAPKPTSVDDILALDREVRRRVRTALGMKEGA